MGKRNRTGFQPVSRMSQPTHEIPAPNPVALKNMQRLIRKPAVPRQNNPNMNKQAPPIN